MKEPIIFIHLGIFISLLFIQKASCRIAVDRRNKGQFGQSFFAKDSLLDPETLFYNSRLQKILEKGLNVTHKEEIAKYGTISRLLGLTAVSDIHMPIHVNVVLIGFDENGNNQLTLPQEQLIQWFQHIDVIIPHTRVPLRQLTCQEDGHCPVFGSQHTPKPLQSYVNFNVSISVSQVDKQVSEAFENAIVSFSRPEDPLFDRNEMLDIYGDVHDRRFNYNNKFRDKFIVDARKMEGFIDNFISTLNQDHKYNIIIVNPAIVGNKEKYGYGVGFSMQEIKLLKEQHDAIKPHMRDISTLQDYSDKPKPLTYTAYKAYNKGLLDQTSLSKYWAHTTKNADYSLPVKYRDMAGKTLAGQAMRAHAIQILQQGPKEEAMKLQRLFYDDFDEGRAKGSFRIRHPDEVCSMDTWVGHHRFFMIDMAADHNNHWGPWVGGQGYKKYNQLPQIETLIDASIESSKNKYLREVDREHFRNRSAEVKIKLDADLEGLKSRIFSQAALQVDNEIRAPDYHGEKYQQQVEDRRQQVQLSYKMAELDLYEQYGLQYCHKQGFGMPQSVCQELQDRVSLIIRMADSHMFKFANNLPIKRNHKWQIFGSGLEDLEKFSSEQKTRTQDTFLAKIGAIISEGVHHVFVPPTAIQKHQEIGRETSSQIHPEKIHFIFHHIREDPPWIQKNVKKTFQNVDVDILKTQIERLRLPSQRFTFQEKFISFSEEPSLHVAFQSSLKTTFHDKDPMKFGEQEERIYLNAEEFQYQLLKSVQVQKSQPFRQFIKSYRNRHGEHHRYEEMQEETEESKDIELPIFFFELHKDYPIFLDKHYVAKSLENMILVIQNSQSSGVHPMDIMCNGGSISRDISTPYQQALQAIAQYLGGVLPSHIGFNNYDESISHSWIWATGSHPLAMVSQGYQYTQTTIDIVQRSYILDAIDTSVDIINHIIQELDGMDIDMEDAREISHVGLYPLDDMVNSYKELVVLWYQMVQRASQMDFDSAFKLIPKLQHQTTKFVEANEEISEIINPSTCQRKLRQRPNTVLSLQIIIICSIVGFVLLIALAVILGLFMGSKKTKYT